MKWVLLEWIDIDVVMNLMQGYVVNFVDVVGYGYEK